MSLKINGMDASGFNDEAELHQDNTGFGRLNRNMGWQQRAGGPGVSEADFLDNSFFSAWDISTSRSPPGDFSESLEILILVKKSICIML